MLFSDIDGSTVLLSRLGDRYADALDAYRSLLRSAWGKWGGREMGTEGDSFFVVFDVASQAVNAALQAQQALAGYDWVDQTPVRARMGLHTGSPAVHDGGYVGMDVHRAARIAGAAHGGQVVVSDVSAQLATRRLPDGVGWLDLGFHRLKDLPLPERLFQLVGPQLQENFPPLKALGATSSLPVPATNLVGRAEELAELAAVVAGRAGRLVTLTGPGGSGKTRLAVGLAQQVRNTFPDGVYFVPLAAATTTEAMWSGVAEILGIPTAQRTPPQLFVHLAQRAALLVLDNLEQLATADGVVAELLIQAPAITVVATSRRPLHLAGEHEHPVLPLQLPDDQSLAEAQRSGAVQMFVEHVVNVRRGFALTADNTADVTEICRRLDGLPLALELAAARTKLLSPHALVGRLDAALELRAPSTVDRPARQQTLRDTIAWSYELLETNQQAFFRRLSVFAGGADIDAVTALTDGLVLAGGDPLDPIGDLLDASLITIADTPDGEPRIGMLETIRSYASEQLAAHGEAEHTRDLHADHYQGLAKKVEEQVRGPQLLSARSQADLELDNIRAALDHRLCALEDGDRSPDRVAAVLCAANDCTPVVIGSSGSYLEGRRWLERTLDVVGDIDTSPQLAACLANLAMTLTWTGEPVAGRDIATRAVDQARATHDIPTEAEAVMWLGLAHLDLGEGDLARSLLEQAVALARMGRRTGQLNTALVNLAFLEVEDYNHNRAVDLLEEARTEAEERTGLYDVAFIDVFLAGLRWNREGTEAARHQVLALTDPVLRIRVPELMLMHARNCAVVLARSQPSHAAALIGAFDAERDRTGTITTAQEKVRLREDLEAAGAPLDSDQWNQHYQLGRTRTLEEVLNDIAP